MKAQPFSASGATNPLNMVAIELLALPFLPRAYTPWEEKEVEEKEVVGVAKDGWDLFVYTLPYIIIICTNYRGVASYIYDARK